MATRRFQADDGTRAGARARAERDFGKDAWEAVLQAFDDLLEAAPAVYPVRYVEALRRVSGRLPPDQARAVVARTGRHEDLAAAAQVTRLLGEAADASRRAAEIVGASEVFAFTLLSLRGGLATLAEAAASAAADAKRAEADLRSLWHPQLDRDQLVRVKGPPDRGNVGLRGETEEERVKTGLRQDLIRQARLEAGQEFADPEKGHPWTWTGSERGKVALPASPATWAAAGIALGIDEECRTSRQFAAVARLWGSALRSRR